MRQPSGSRGHTSTEEEASGFSRVDATINGEHMPTDDNASVKARIQKDITSFHANFAAISSLRKDAKVAKMVEMSLMYAKDAKSYLEKNDLYTAFSCISYAHGILDAIKNIFGE